jgi:pyruvate dehydrogenase E1 component alpha subunit
MLSILAELMGRTGGCSKGKGGMFSFYSPERQHWGCHGLAAAQTPLANGLAFAMKLKSEPGAVVCFMGESAANQGVFHETLNLAALFDLPVIFVIENNGFGMFTSQERSSRFTECVARRAETYGIEWDICNDENIPVMHAKIATALQRARVESRPTVLEITTMRYYGWTISDANNWRYRKREIVEERKEHSDPMTLWKQHLIDQGTLSETEARQMGESAKAEAIDATKLAKLSPPQTMESILEDVYWESDHETPASKTGHHFFS